MAPHPYLTVLSDEEVHQIHLASLQVLEEVGLWLPNQEVLCILEGAGARVDFTGSSGRGHWTGDRRWHARTANR